MIRHSAILALLIAPILTTGQVGIGTTNVHASAKFQVESSNKGFLQPRVTLTGTDDNSTIASPATGLMVFNTATAGSGTTSVTPGVYYYSGSAWQRLSDTQPAVFVNGTLNSHNGGLEIIAPDPPSSFTLGSITLPPGKWEVMLNIVNHCLQTPGTLIACNFYINYWLQDNTNATSISYVLPAAITNITADVTVPGGASFTAEMAAGAVVQNNGRFQINNTSGNNKTYYLFAIESTPCGDPVFNDATPIYNGLGSGNFKQNRFYATKVY